MDKSRELQSCLKLAFDYKSADKICAGLRCMDTAAMVYNLGEPVDRGYPSWRITDTRRRSSETQPMSITTRREFKKGC